jgi:hypothetical protein
LFKKSRFWNRASSTTLFGATFESFQDSPYFGALPMNVRSCAAASQK